MGRAAAGGRLGVGPAAKAGHMSYRQIIRSADRPNMRNGTPKATCKECGFEWFGSTAAHALRTIGVCTRCRGEVAFAEDAPFPPLMDETPDVPAHLVLGSPRL